MNRTLSIIAAVSAATALAACSKAQDAPKAEVAAVEIAEAPAAEPAVTVPANGGLSDAGRAFAASLPPEDLGKARLMCIEPLRTATFWAKHIADADLAAALKAAPSMSRAAILTKPPMNELSLDQARAIMDSAPKFDGDSQLTAEDTVALKQCIQIAYHFAEEQAAGR